MSFTYTAGNSTYDSTTHKTTTSGGSWSDSKGSVTVTNHSNVRIDADFSFTGATGITGKFYDKSAEGATYTESTAKKLSLLSGEDKTAEGETYTTPAATIYFGIDSASTPISATGSLGTITVNIAKDDKVYTGEELQAALNKVAKTGGTVKLGADVTLPTQGGLGLAGCSAAFENGKKITLDLNDHTVTGLISIYNSGSNATEKLFIKNGTIQCSTEQTLPDGFGAITGYNVNIEIDRVTINATGFLAVLNYGGNMKIMDSTLTGGQNDSHNRIITIYHADSQLVFSGTVSVENAIMPNGEYTIKAEAGTYNFDPTNYVDTGTYTVTDNSDGTWTVTVNA